METRFGTNSYPHPMFSEITYENLDTELINALLNDGRASLRSLAKELVVSVTTISNHIGELEDEGMIESYSPEVNYDELGYDTTATIQLSVEGSALTDFTDDLREHSQIISIHEVTGDYDAIAVGKSRDTDEMNDQIKAFLSDSGVKESNTNIVLNTVSEHEQFELSTS
jgi:DNA-binding Lrp family transcriptional regulator